MLGRIFSLPAKNIYGMTWDTQYLVWPEGQTICLDEAYIYSKLMKRNWRARKPIGYFCVLDQYIMIFKENMKTQEMKDSGIQPPGNETA